MISKIVLKILAATYITSTRKLSNRMTHEGAKGDKPPGVVGVVRKEKEKLTRQKNGGDAASKGVGVAHEPFRQ